MKYIIIILLFASCTTQRKATEYMDNHPKEAAKYYKDKYPYKDSTVVTVVYDTILKDSIVAGFNPITDSLMEVADNLNQAVKEAQDQVAYMQREKDYTEGAVQKLKSQLASIPRIDTAAFRKRVEKELIARIPVPKFVTNDHYQENTARLQYYTILEAEHKKLLEEKTDLSHLFGWLLAALIRKWWFWLIVVAFGGWVYWRIRAGALNSILSSIKNKT